jgi:hypothetical protein
VRLYGGSTYDLGSALADLIACSCPEELYSAQEKLSPWDTAHGDNAAVADKDRAFLLVIDKNPGPKIAATGRLLSPSQC